jgi:hypothetical protein
VLYLDRIRWKKKLDRLIDARDAVVHRTVHACQACSGEMAEN